MASTHNLGGNYWGSLVNQDNSATPLLTQLCEGLVKIISQLDPGPDTELTPQRLSTFYRSVGGNDFVFRELGHPGLSLMYKTLGCFHSLQPTVSPYEPPSVPCLLPPGFVRWQTLQIQLHPDEHARCMQKAVELYDVPKSGGGTFPKSIPRESFPSVPDEAMEKWHNMILGRLDEGHHRLKNSPYCSPYEGPDRAEGYFPRSPHLRRTSRPPRTDNQDLPHRLSSSSRRRSSVPNVPSPIQTPEHGDNLHWASDQAYSAPNSANPRSPRHRTSDTTFSQRPPSQSHHRASTLHNTNHTNVTSTNNTSAKSFSLNFENFHIPFISSPFNSKKSRERSSTSAARNRAPPRSPSRSEAVSTGSEASSEDSLPRKQRYERDRRRASLAPPSEYNRYQRRHSHDASYLPRPMHIPAFPPQSQNSHNAYNHNHHPYIPSTGPMPIPLREGLYSNGGGASSAPDSPNGAHANPKLRVIDPTGVDRSGERGRERRHNLGETLQERRAVSAGRQSRSDDRRGGKSIDRSGRFEADRFDMRREGKPLRVNTVAGSGAARRVRNSEVRTAGVPNLRRVPPMTLSGGGRR